MQTYLYYLLRIWLLNYSVNGVKVKSFLSGNGDERYVMEWLKINFAVLLL